MFHKNDKVELIIPCNQTDELMKIKVGDIGICISDENDDMIFVDFGDTTKPGWILTSRLKTVNTIKYPKLTKEELITFKNLLNIFHKEFKDRANTDIDLFVNICNNALYDMMKEIDKEEF